ncbi:uncharacterized protein LOC115755645 isoform X2 [Rhodamnia argentea]|uniref:Uncharacterized protein LOC115755645 isoform X2 n=1 Tax=Rhodamnia argentea TaxID=178133 RepID=A0ABM3H1M9_9MYRT|nr:uncharacterized protein LOC115755645 isoform X2 [Rhodamnia argentea]
MAIFSSGSSATTWLLSLKVLLASTLVLSAAVLLNLSLPAITGFVTSELPSIYGLLLTWLRPPYLYILINCIIISIVASSKLQHKADDRVVPELAMAEYVAPPPEAVVRAPAEDLKVPGAVYGNVYDPRLVKLGVDAYGGADAGALEAEKVDDEAEKVDDKAVVAADGGDDPMVPESASPPQRNDSSDFSFLSPNEDRTEKPPVSSRFGHRKSAKSSPEVGRPLRVSRPKRNDTLESTWRTITDGRAMPLARHLKKSDTWDSHARRNDENSPPPQPKMKKAETFATGPGPTNVPASPSLGQEDLNRRVEAFIRKFNEQMRLQRQESLNQLQEMINRGAG